MSNYILTFWKGWLQQGFFYKIWSFYSTCQSNVTKCQQLLKWEKCKRFCIKGQRSSHFFSSSISLFLHRVFLPVLGWDCGCLKGSLGCRLRFAQRTFPSLGLSVIFLATWRLEEAALIETHPSPSTSSSDSLSLFQKSLSKYREKEREGWRSERRREEKEDGWKAEAEKGGEKDNSWEEK